MKTKGLEEAIAQIKGIDQQIRKYVDKPHGGGSPFWREVRHLSQEEWETIQRIVTEYELPCSLRHTAYGFDFLVYSHGMVEGENPQCILGIDNGQFPFKSAHKGFAGQEETLEVLSVLTHTPRNAELLRWYGFRALESAESYAY